MKKSLLILCLLAYTLFAQEIAVVKLLKGDVKALSGDKKLNLEVGNMLDEHMVVQTFENSSATIVFNDNSILVLGENSVINLKKYTFEPKNKLYDFKLFLSNGSAVFESGDIGKFSPESFVFETPQGTVAIRGTKFIVNVE